jgi:hypothetical protein
VGQLGRGDRNQLDYARQEQRAICIHDRDDFPALTQEYALRGIPHTGIPYILQALYRELLRRLLRFLSIPTPSHVERVFIGLP